MSATKEIPVVPEPVAEQPAPQPAPQDQPRPPARRRRRGRTAAVVLAVILAGGAAGVGTGLVLRNNGSAGAEPSPTASAAPLPATVTSIDPSGGSGLRLQDGQWRTQTYRTAAFGNLKPGVGLLLDLEAARTVHDVSFTAGPGPLTVELRAGDTASQSADDYTAVGSPVTADGATTLEAGAGGSHRYWLMWITELAATDGGYRAVLSEPVVRGS